MSTFVMPLFGALKPNLVHVGSSLGQGRRLSLRVLSEGVVSWLFSHYAAHVLNRVGR